MNLQKRFEKFIQYEPNTGCWLWDGNRHRDGYGKFKASNGKQCFAHRVSYELYVGIVSDDLLVCHTCDVPECVNPDHLFIGTHQDNVRDMHKKSRASNRTGSNHPMSKLTNDDIRQIRKDSRLHREIAADYGVVRSVITQIINRKKWAHVK